MPILIKEKKENFKSMISASTLRHEEQKEQIQPNVSKRKEIKIRADIIEIENR